jgi:NADH-quinone oxidoreductase subunit J
MFGTLSQLNGLMCSPALAQATMPAAGTEGGSSALAVTVLVLCVIAGVGTAMLLPSRREASWRKIGGAVVIAAALIGLALLVRNFQSLDAGINVYFWVFAAIALFGAMRVVTHARPVYSALYFVLTVFATAGLFILLWAEFMAAALVLIYAGAILVTYVFVIMLAAQPGGSTGNKGNSDVAEYDAVSREPVLASAVGFLLMALLLMVVLDRGEPAPRIAAAAAQPAPTTQAVAATGGVQSLGKFLFDKHLVNLELAGLILTMAVVGAIVIARRRVIEEGADVAPGSVVDELTVGPSPTSDDPHSIPVYGTDNPRQKEYPET